MKRITQNIPNAITLLNLLAGIFSIVWASEGLYETAAWFILAAAVCDFLDGFAARLLKVRSDIGPQLDSLADLVSFGLAPAYLLVQSNLMIYHSEHTASGLSSADWGTQFLILLPLCLPVFASIRLAKFNLDQRQRSLFIGLPAPAAGLFFASLIFCYYRNGFELLSNIVVWDALAIGFSALMVLPLKMIFFKFQGIK